MALNIGDITFGVEAQTAGLQKAINRIQNFRRVVDETAKAQQAGSAKAAAALARQESAMKRALQQAINMRAEMKRLGASPQDLANVTHAIQRLTKEMSAGKLSTVEFTRSTDAFNIRMKRLNRTVKDLRMKEAAKRTGRFNKVIRDLESASVLAVGPLSGLGARIRAISAITSRSTLAIAGLFGAITGLTIGLIGVVRSSVNATKQFNEMRARISATTGSIVLAEIQLSEVAKTADKLGLDLQTASRGFSALAAASRGSALEGEATVEIFEGLSMAAAAMRLNSQQLEGAIRAVEQMMSKGTVQAEELRGQLGERIPGAFRLAAQAMGVSTKELNKMLQQGKVVSDDFLPKFAKRLKEAFGTAALKNADSLTGALNQLSNATFEFFRELDKVISASDAFKSIIQGLTSVIRSLTKNMDVLLGTIGAIGGALLAAFAPTIIGGVITFFRFLAGATLIKGLLSLATAVRAVATGTSILSVAMMAIPGMALLKVLGRIALVVAGAAIGFRTMSSAVGDTTDKTQQLIDKLHAYNEVAKQQGGIHRRNAEEAVASVEKQIEALDLQRRVLTTHIQSMTKLMQENSFIEALAQTVDELTLGLTNLSLKGDVDAMVEQLNRIGKQSLELTKELAELKKQKIYDPTESGIGEMDKDLERFLKDLRDAKAEMEGFKRILAAGPTTMQEFIDLKALEDAQLELRKFSDAQKEVIRNEIGKMMGQDFATAAEALAFLRQDFNSTEDALKAFEDALRSTPQVMADYTDEMERMSRKLAALRSGSLAVEQFNQEEQITAALKAQKEALDKTNLSAEKRNELLDAYEKRLRAVTEAEANFSDASDRLAQTISQQFEDAILNAKSLTDFINDLDQALVKMITRIAVTEPLEKMLRGVFQGNSVGGGGGGGGIADIIGNIFSGFATGGDFRVGGVGGVDSQLVAFKATPGEQVSVRTRGQQAQSSGGGVTIVNQFQISAPNGNIPRKTQQQIATEAGRATQRALRRNT